LTLSVLSIALRFGIIIKRPFIRTRHRMDLWRI
jgi:hypothetical protein